MRIDQNIDSSWAQISSPPSSTPWYWIAITRTSGGVLGGVDIQRIKIYTHSTEIKNNGVINFHGKARGFKGIDLDPNLLRGVGGGTNPGSQNVFYSSNMSVGSDFNSFTTANRAAGGRFRIPKDFDSSSPWRLIITYFGTTAPSGTTINITLRALIVQPGSVVGTAALGAPDPNQVDQTTTFVFTAALNTLQELVFNFAPPNYSQTDNTVTKRLILHISRGVDTYAGSFVIDTMELKYVSNTASGGFIG